MTNGAHVNIYRNGASVLPLRQGRDLFAASQFLAVTCYWRLNSTFQVFRRAKPVNRKMYVLRVKFLYEKKSLYGGP